MLLSHILVCRVDRDPGAEKRKVINLPEKASSALRRRRKKTGKQNETAATASKLSHVPLFFTIGSCNAPAATDEEHHTAQ